MCIRRGPGKTIIRSLGSQVSGRGSDRGAEDLDADGEECYDECDETGGEDDPPLHFDMIGEVLEPSGHEPPGDGSGEQEREGDEADELTGDERHDARRTGAECFADSDLFATDFHGVGDEAQEAETGDEDGDDREAVEEGGGALIGSVKAIEMFVEKGIGEREAAIVFFPLRLDGANGFGCGAFIGFDISHTKAIPIDKDGGFNFVLKRRDMHVFGHADNGSPFIAKTECFTDGIGDTRLANGGLIEYIMTGICRRSRERASFFQLDTKHREKRSIDREGMNEKARSR